MLYETSQRPATDRDKLYISLFASVFLVRGDNIFVAKRAASQQLVDPVVEEMAEEKIFLPIEVQIRHPEKMQDFQKQRLELDSRGISVASVYALQAFRYSLIEKEDAIESRLRKKAMNETKRIQRKMIESKGDPVAFITIKSEAKSLADNHTLTLMSLKEEKKSLDIVMGDWSHQEREEFLKTDADSALYVETKEIGEYGRACIYARVISTLNERTKKDYPEAREFIDSMIKGILLGEESVSVREAAWKKAHMRGTPSFKKSDLGSMRRSE